MTRRLPLTRSVSAQDSFASGSGGGSGKYLENGVVLTAAGIEETKKMLISKRESDRLEGLKRVIAVSTNTLVRPLILTPITLHADDDKELACDIILPTGDFTSFAVNAAASTHPHLALHRALRCRVA